MSRTGSGSFNRRKAVGDMAAAFADDFAKIVLGIPVLRNQLFVSERLFERIEVGSLDIFDDRDLERRPIIHIANDHRNIRKPASCAARQRRSPAMIS